MSASDDDGPSLSPEVSAAGVDVPDASLEDEDVTDATDRGVSLHLSDHLMRHSIEEIQGRSVPPFTLPSFSSRSDTVSKNEYFARFLPSILAECTEQLAATSEQGTTITGTINRVKQSKMISLSINSTDRPQVDYPLVRVVVALNVEGLSGCIAMLENMNSFGPYVTFPSRHLGDTVVKSLVGKEVTLLLMGSIVPSERMAEACSRRIIDAKMFRTLAKGEPSVPANIETKEFSTALNAEQNKAIHLMHSTSDNIICIEGPPGTGKTTTVVEMIHQSDPDPLHKTLVMGPSNKAVHTDAERFMRKYGESYYKQGRSIAVVGVAEKLPESLRDISVDDVAEITLSWLHRTRAAVCNTTDDDATLDALLHSLCTTYNTRILPSLLRMAPSIDDQLPPPIPLTDSTIGSKIRLLKHTSSYIIKVDVEAVCIADCSVLFSTLVSSGRALVRKNLALTKKGRKSARGGAGKMKRSRTANNVHCLIVDEAAQALVPEALIALSLLPYRLIVVGDVHQLQPCVVSNVDAASFMQSVMDTSGCQTVMLKEQYRMHEAIQRFPSKMFYNGELRVGGNVADRSWSYPAAGPSYLRPYVFFDVNGVETAGQNSSLRNKAEVEAVCKVLTVLKAMQGGWRCSIGVIAMYNNQALLIKQRAAELQIKNLRVSTVDSFQGDESDVILISMVRSNAAGSVGFLKDERRLNVALTRARHSLLIFGSASTLACSTSPHCSALISDAKERKVLLTSDVLQESFTFRGPPQAIPMKRPKRGEEEEGDAVQRGGGGGRAPQKASEKVKVEQKAYGDDRGGKGGNGRGRGIFVPASYYEEDQYQGSDQRGNPGRGQPVSGKGRGRGEPVWGNRGGDGGGGGGGGGGGNRRNTHSGKGRGTQGKGRGTPCATR